MLSKKYRLPIQEFIKSRSNIIKGDYFIFKFKKNNLLFSRIGVIISGKVNKSAVKRNKIKRIIFDFFRLKEYHLGAGKDILFIVLLSVNKLTKAEIGREIENMLNKM